MPEGLLVWVVLNAVGLRREALEGGDTLTGGEPTYDPEGVYPVCCVPAGIRWSLDKPAASPCGRDVPAIADSDAKLEGEATGGVPWSP